MQEGIGDETPNMLAERILTSLDSLSQPLPQKDQRARLMRRHIEEKVLVANPDVEAIDTTDAFKDLDTRQKTDLLYEKLMAREKAWEEIRRQRRTSSENVVEEVNPYLVAEIRELWRDSNVQDRFLDRYSQARIDFGDFRKSEGGKDGRAIGGKEWRTINEDIVRARQEHEEVSKELFLGQVQRTDNVSAARGKVTQLARRIIQLEQQRGKIINLGQDAKPAYGASVDTDIAAEIQFEEIAEYHRQFKEDGFIWLPYEEKLYEKAIAALQNGRWPVLLGEAGTGKGKLAVAAAKALTGEEPTRLRCSSTTNENDLLGSRDIASTAEGGSSYITYGPAMQAATGYERSDKTQKIATGRIVRFDEAGRLGDKGYAAIKELREMRPGNLLQGKRVLPGFAAIWTTNPVGPRYPNRNDPDPAMRRELSYINVDYPPMSHEDPEIYEFMLATLMDGNNHISVAKEELAPGYEPKTVQIDGKAATYEDLVQDPTDLQHGVAYRLSFALRAIQDAFTYGNSETIPDTALRYDPGEGKIVPAGSGEPLTLTTSTITLGELASWMAGFNERFQKDQPEFQTKNLTQWLQYKARLYLEQTDVVDRDKIHAIFDHFHIFDPAPDLAESVPLTPKDIGYLSPRVPRPLTITSADTAAGETTPAIPEPSMHEDVQCMLEDGTTVMAHREDFLFEKNGKKIRLKPGSRFKAGEERLEFLGYSGDKVVVRIDTGDPNAAIHRLLDKEAVIQEFDWDLIEYAKELFGENFFGQEEVEKAFGVTLSLDQIPDLFDKFTQEELDRAASLGQRLMLRINRAADGSPLTMKKMNEILQPQLAAAAKGKVLLSVDWYKDEEFFTKDVSRAEWALVSNEVIQNTPNKDYLQQTEILIDYLQNTVFDGQPMPLRYQNAIAEFGRHKARIRELIDKRDNGNIIEATQKEAAELLETLEITKLTRQTPVEVLYDLLLHFQNRGEPRLLPDMYTWTCSRSSSGALVMMGYFDEDGTDVSDRWPLDQYPAFGASLSR